MIDFEKHYGTINVKELIEIIESLNVYKPEVIEYCKKRLQQVNISKEILKSYATDVLKIRFYNYFVDKKYLSNEPISMDSYFLNPKEVKKCFRESKSEYISYITNATSNLRI
jgi:hypothetical protein